MRKMAKVAKVAVLGLLAGATVFEVGSCTTQEVKTQLSKGLTTSMNGLFNVVATDLANELLDVDD